MELCAFQSEEKNFSPYKCGPPYWWLVSVFGDYIRHSRNGDSPGTATIAPALTIVASVDI